jgi:hypothetical protein
MKDPQTEARLFLYDLANLAKEHWFKGVEHWSLVLANNAEKLAVEKQYQPVLNITGEPEFLQKVYELMSAEMKFNPIPVEVPERGTRKEPATYLIAFNSERQRK